MAHFPLIGLTAHCDEGDAAALWPGHPLLAVDRRYAEAVSRAGGTPLVIPVLSAGKAEAYLDCLDGLIFTGGGPLAARPGEPLGGLAATNPRRHAWESELLKGALARDLPLLGICRGAQMLNEALGGTLVNLSPAGVALHQQETSGLPLEEPVHEVTLAAGSRLAGLLGTEQVIVNSLHRQAVQKPGRGLRVVAWASDGVGEAVESEAHIFVLGLQFHPELLARRMPVWDNVFRALVNAAGARGR